MSSVSPPPRLRRIPATRLRMRRTIGSSGPTLVATTFSRSGPRRAAPTRWPTKKPTSSSFSASTPPVAPIQSRIVPVTLVWSVARVARAARAESLGAAALAGAGTAEETPGMTWGFRAAGADRAVARSALAASRLGLAAARLGLAAARLGLAAAQEMAAAQVVAAAQVELVAARVMAAPAAVVQSAMVAALPVVARAPRVEPATAVARPKPVAAWQAAGTPAKAAVTRAGRRAAVDPPCKAAAPAMAVLRRAPPLPMGVAVPSATTPRSR